MRYGNQASPETYAIIGAAIEVQRHLCTGLLESAYGDALEIEFQERGVAFAREVGVPILYKRRVLKTRYRADFVCQGDLILELKASTSLGAADQAKMWHYLSATGLKLGLLLNFGHAPLQIRRFANGVEDRIFADSADFAASPGGEAEVALREDFAASPPNEPDVAPPSSRSTG